MKRMNPGGTESAIPPCLASLLGANVWFEIPSGLTPRRQDAKVFFGQAVNHPLYHFTFHDDVRPESLLKTQSFIHNGDAPGAPLAVPASPTL